MGLRISASLIVVALAVGPQDALAGAPGTPEAGPSGVGASTSGGDSNPRVQKINQYALQSTTVIRQLLTDAKAI